MVLLQAIVDVVASSGWLHPALAAMEMCQMVVQGQWEKDSPLLQLPHITPQIAAAAAAKDIGTVFDLIEMDEEERRELLQVRLLIRNVTLCYMTQLSQGAANMVSPKVSSHNGDRESGSVYTVAWQSHTQGVMCNL